MADYPRLAAMELIRERLCADEAGGVEFPNGQSLAVDRPCVLLYVPNAGRAELTVADPTQREPDLSLELAGAVRASLGVSLPRGEYAGSSVRVTIR